MNSSRLKTASQIALVSYLVVMFLGTHLSPTSPLLPSGARHLDKLYHSLAYAILAGLLATTWQLAAGTLYIRHLCWVWLAVVIWAAFDEITQIPFNRECNIQDWTADAIGAAVGILAFVWLRKKLSATTAESDSPR